MKNTEIVKCLTKEIGLVFPIESQRIQGKQPTGSINKKSKFRNACDQFTSKKRQVMRDGIPDVVSLPPNDDPTETTQEELDYIYSTDKWLVFVLNHLPRNLKMPQDEKKINKLKSFLEKIFKLRKARKEAEQASITKSRNNRNNASFKKLNDLLGILDTHYGWESRTTPLAANQYLLNQSYSFISGPKTITEIANTMQQVFAELDEDAVNEYLTNQFKLNIKNHENLESIITWFEIKPFVDELDQS